MAKFVSEPFTLSNVTLAYVDSKHTSIFKPEIKKPGTPDQYERYGCTLFLHEQARQQLDAHVNDIGRRAYPQEWDNPNARLSHAIRNSHEKGSSYEAVAPYFVTAVSNQQPVIVDTQLEPIINVIDPATGQKPIYDGVIANVRVVVADYNIDGGRGVSVKINGIQKVADGAKLNLDSQESAAAMFGGQPSQPPAGAQAPRFDPQTGQPIAPQPTSAPRPAFDPQTGQPIAPQPTSAPQPAFDPQTGRPIPPYNP